MAVVPPAPTPAPAGPVALVSLRNAALFLVQRISEGLTLCVLLLSAVLAISSIAEISSRQQARTEVDRVEREETALIMGQVSSVPVAQAGAEDATGQQLLRQHLRGVSRIHAYSMEARNQIDSLSVRGAGESRQGVTRILSDYQVKVSEVRNELMDSFWKEPLKGDGRTAVGKVTPEAPLETPWVERLSLHLRGLWAQLPLEQSRTDYLLALVVSCCALVGAIIAMMREGGARFATKQIVLGLASGFVAFLSLRGGRSVFMLELTGEVPHFNPYSMAFAGLLVGLFTSKAYELLGVLVQELDGRVRAMVQGPSAAKAVPPNEPEQNP
ncbi:hypothetical protein [Corallococcus sp. Z5C101001]|uniref:hypothetical protein n=1 Tax=Corallococcus sp. Z5C101001 TaxID=2596829 RepID=UPI001180DBF7|nr:hypothetical protein [Corallococcus sp. Z5C101001]TSC22843.1 hypothetical protein FOF48_32440 [Corallococcus sp. Z5C101001]